MKTLIMIVVAVLLAGCVASLKEVSADLSACRAANMIPAVDENGVVEVINGKPVMQTEVGACPAEWAAWNEADERHARAVARRETPSCPKGTISWCTTRFSITMECSCESHADVRDALGDGGGRY